MDFCSRPQRSRTWAGGTREAGPPDQRERSAGDSAALYSEPTMIGNFCGSYNRDTNNKIVLSLLINVIGISLHPLPPFGNLRWRSPTHRIRFEYIKKSGWQIMIPKDFLANHVITNKVLLKSDIFSSNKNFVSKNDQKNFKGFRNSELLILWLRVPLKS